MTRTELSIDTGEGTCRATLHTPDDGDHGDGPWPGVLYYPDAGGVRETFAAMADRLAAQGYAVLLPDIYHRTPYEPFDTDTLFTDPDAFARLRTLMESLTPDRVVVDAGAYLDALDAHPQVSGTAFGAAGYCAGGAMVLRAAAARPGQVAATASFHPGGLAVADDPASPHLLADRIAAAVLVAAAQDDQLFPPEQIDRLRGAFDDAGVRAGVETYPAAHGFAVPDNPTHDDAADRRHRAAMADLFAAHLGRR